MSVRNRRRSEVELLQEARSILFPDGSDTEDEDHTGAVRVEQTAVQTDHTDAVRIEPAAVQTGRTDAISTEAEYRQTEDHTDAVRTEPIAIQTDPTDSVSAQRLIQTAGWIGWRT